MFSVVCVYNDRAILRDCLLKSLKGQTTAYELILVDNSGRQYNSASEALNWGGRKAKGNYIMFAH
jgi:glycosyltransferase involved in cell wall biosynthesis